MINIGESDAVAACCDAAEKCCCSIKSDIEARIAKVSADHTMDINDNPMKLKAAQL
jgi:hypothetical protein